MDNLTIIMWIISSLDYGPPFKSFQIAEFSVSLDLHFKFEMRQVDPKQFSLSLCLSVLSRFFVVR